MQAQGNWRSIRLKRRRRLWCLLPQSKTASSVLRWLEALQLGIVLFRHKSVAGKKTKRNDTMISILTQERLLGATLGVVLTGVVVFEQRRYIYSSISNTQSHSQVREPIFGKKSRSEFAHMWNKTVDETFGPLIRSLSSRGW